MIRRQLSEQSVARRTAITEGKPPSTETAELEPTATGLFRKLGSDGLSLLEQVGSPAAAPPPDQAPAGAPGKGPPLPRVSYEPAKDPDRFTEVSGPPTGQIPKHNLASIRLDPSPVPRSPPRRKIGLWIAVAAVFAAAGGFTTWRFTRGPAADQPTRAPAHDAGPVESMGTFEIDSVPPHAIVTVGDRVLGEAPQVARVASGVKAHIKLALKGFQAYEDDLAVEPGKTVVVRPRLPPAPATLHVETTPPGALVALAEQPLGTTPFTRSVEVVRGAELAITRAGYEPIKLKIDLSAGEETRVVRELKELQKYGVVLVVVNGAAEWGYVWWKGKNLGQNYTMAGGQTPFKLPVGRQELTITHPRTASQHVTVDVSEQAPARLTVTLP